MGVQRIASPPPAGSAASVGPMSSLAFAAMSPGSKYERLESNIGEGTYGKVHKARDLKTGRTVAIKKAKASAADRDVGGSVGFTAIREMKLMQAISHPNVMGCLDVFADGGAVHLVMEFMDGDLKVLIDNKCVSLAEAHVKCLTRQILAGAQALHQKWFLHRDLTPTNILLEYSSGIAKISDFGFARTVGHCDRPLTPICTTLPYRAPELLYGAKFYGPSVDVWSIGCIVGEMFLRQPLFQGRGEFDMLTKIFEQRGTPSEDLWRDVSALPRFVEFSHHPKAPLCDMLPTASKFAHNFIDDLLSLDPKQRPGPGCALAHEFFTSAPPAACRPADLPFVRRGTGGSAPS